MKSFLCIIALFSCLTANAAVVTGTGSHWTYNLSSNLVFYLLLNAPSGGENDSLGVENFTANNSPTAEFENRFFTLTNRATTTASSQTFSRADNANLSITNDITFAFWTYWSNSVVENTVGKWANTLQKSYCMNWNAGGPTDTLSWVLTSDGNTDKPCSIILKATNWFHIAGTWSSGDGKSRLYTNGILAWTTNFTGGIFDSTSQLTVMGGQPGVGANHTGKMSNVGLWSRCLSASEIWYLYGNGRGTRYPK